MDIYTDREIKNQLRSKYGLSGGDFEVLSKTNPRLLRKLLRDDMKVELEDLSPRRYDSDKFSAPFFSTVYNGMFGTAMDEVGDSLGQSVFDAMGSAPGTGMGEFVHDVDNAWNYGALKGLISAPIKYMADQHEARSMSIKYNNLMRRLYNKLYNENSEN